MNTHYLKIMVKDQKLAINSILVTKQNKKCLILYFQFFIFFFLFYSTKNLEILNRKEEIFEKKNN
jgi:hypothetical protein